jgi:hypothetical protein
VCSTPYRSQISFVRDTCLTAIAENTTLQEVNKGLFEKVKKKNKPKTKQYFGGARILTVADMIKQQEIRQDKNNTVQEEKARAKALRGKVTFAKLVWKEFRMDIDIFE